MAATGSGVGKGMTTITLISADNERFEVSEAAASLSQTISNMIEDDCTDGGIPLPNVTGSVLAKVLEYCNKHAAATGASSEAAGSSNAGANSEKEGNSSAAAAASDVDKELASFDKVFIDVDQAMLHDLLMAANYLNVKGLMDIATQKVADMIKGKTPEQIRQTFGMKNDFTAEEEEEIRKECPWAFE